MHPGTVCAAMAAGALLSPLTASAQDSPLSVLAAVQSQRVYVGQHFLLQLQVQGSDQPDPVDISALEADFAVTEAGGGSSNSTSVSIVNGRMTQQVRRGYNLNYRLAPRRAGNLRIPSLTVTANGQTASTQPIALAVQPPQENDDFKLRLELSETRAYVGQPVTLTATWYIGRQPENFRFTMPLLDDERFEIRDLASDAALRGQGRNDVMEIRLGDRTAIARQSQGQIAGRTYTTLRFRKLLVPRESGRIEIAAATVTFDTPRPGQARSRSLFDDFFGGGFSGAFGGRPVMETLAIPSNRPRLDVLDLPSTGRPASFNGWIGKFDIEAQAQPTAVDVGEPITLSLKVKGTGMPLSSRPPRLDQQPALTNDFQVPREIGAGEEQGGSWEFTQTLRAKHDRVAEIPQIELPYFDPDAGEYRIARSEPIPLEVAAARIVTAEDAEGVGNVPSQFTVESTDEGIAHNYVDASALEPMDYGAGSWIRALGPTPLALAILLVPPIAFLALVVVRSGRRYSGGLRWRSRSAYSHWRKSAAAVHPDQMAGPEVAAAILVAIREYLGIRLAGSSNAAAAWTSSDAEQRLRQLVQSGKAKGTIVEDAGLTALRDVFERCEAGSYAGGGAQDADWGKKLLSDAQATVDGIEESLR